ncbi:DUF1161 domain-containing protein [Xenorhabdus sp. 42]|uniref:DUF1161 domain-containing protein n=1 Tax=Xenorhabdus szentirmaii TaxID=290112 RepID=A0AAW3YUK3_9GAMM|nr:MULTISPECIES: DUF1161 domain-containing protein [unclassified Xenorhabdus]MBD2791556.1 DUF1161 domain-containing protein [Xenorhabdus sp. CUL]MBD2800549.1 DUF1161 domain-containing protein [Xenorhabdus sp. M]MBD2805236.1 DUF1161 domain-containing protein [Xenorhabdus sp. ZM]MBD2821766.1 DUF1161 domain-containing protein [Xenorhabdus sp. 42]MBD2826406.1 DUF1161 domain-containing protein [Xenorhabdus sp. 5]
MKKILLIGSLFFALSPFAVQATQKVTCESLKQEIAQKIIKNGVSEGDFKLEIIPDEQNVKGNVVTGNEKVVGHCDLGKKKIVYTRFSKSKSLSSNAPSDSTELHE